jgi:hypothetical protein
MVVQALPYVCRFPITIKYYYNISEMHAIFSFTGIKAQSIRCGRGIRALPPSPPPSKARLT